MNEKIVFHGSPRKFDSETANPKLNRRINSEGKVIFNEESFHATPHKWIALAYTYTPKQIPGQPDGVLYGMGVNLYEANMQVAIIGAGSLEESLFALYGDGGFVYHFDDGNFVYKEGLGNHEVVSNSPTRPLHVEVVENPVEDMKKEGVTFHFVDITV
jgi:hypothetical protein